ncbi:MBL fold metallo-hydrolase [Pseudonocardia ailaonensis]|uniref:MBL fold metallo-hydrolase n=1 Tax=Pseudonocardia ailaonensis TaxID=367279 RepID=A0ABN2N5I5_9PSEU
MFAHLQPPGGWGLSNAALVRGPDALVLVDTAATEARTRDLVAAIARVDRRPVSALVATHDHGDHTFGNSAFADTATIVSHHRARAGVVTRGLAMTELWPDTDWGDLRVAPPTLTYSSALTLHAGQPVELIHPGPAHTTGDTLVWLPERRVLIAGDVVLGGVTPFVLMGSVRGTLDTLDLIRDLDPLVIVGGHGTVTGPEALDVAEAYLQRVLALAREGHEQGLGPLEVARRAGYGEFADLLDAERLVANLHRAYREIDASGSPLAVHLPSAPATADMVALRGGPLECLA